MLTRDSICVALVLSFPWDLNPRPSGSIGIVRFRAIARYVSAIRRARFQDRPHPRFSWAVTIMVWPTWGSAPNVSWFHSRIRSDPMAAGRYPRLREYPHPPPPSRSNTTRIINTVVISISSPLLDPVRWPVLCRLGAKAECAGTRGRNPRFPQRCYVVLCAIFAVHKARSGIGQTSHQTPKRQGHGALVVPWGRGDIWSQ